MIPRKSGKMNTIIIDNTDFNFLIHSGLEQTLIECIKINSVTNINRVSVNLTLDKIGQILEFLGNDLMQNGFNNNDEPNEYGIRLENLIDIFSRHFYNSN